MIEIRPFFTLGGAGCVIVETDSELCEAIKTGLRFSPVSECSVREVREGTEADLAKHVYVSTACQHGLHDRCRQQCKFCETPCLCDCHRTP